MDNNTVDSYKKKLTGNDSVDINILRSIGEFYYLGKDGSCQDYKEAVYYLQKAAAAGDAHSMFLLANCYYYGGHGIKYDDVLAFNWCEKAVKCGSKDAMKLMSKLYSDGIGTEKDTEAAKLWANRYNNVATGTETKTISEEEEKELFVNELTDGMFKKVIRKDVEEKTIENNEVSERSETAEELFKEGYDYSYGVNGKQTDYKKAMDCFIRSAAYNYAPAQFFIGAMYNYGKGVNEDHKKAIDYYKLSAEQGYDKALKELGLIYFFGRSGEKKNHKIAKEYFQKLAETGNPDATFFLGFIYEFGDEVEHDYINAFNYYQKSAEKGNPQAQYSLGKMYESGKSVEQDYKKAFELFKKAAEQGDPYAMYSLAILYEEGKGVEKDFGLSADYLMKAADKGNEEAKIRIEKIKSFAESKNKSEQSGNIESISLNTRKDYPLIGDESRFIRIREAGTDDELVDDLELDPDKVYEIRVFFDNSSESGVAKDVIIKVDIHKEDNAIHASIRSSNASPPTIESKITIGYDNQKYRMQFRKDNIIIVSGWEINGTVLDYEKLFGEEGELAGVRKQDGLLPAGREFEGFILFYIRIVPLEEKNESSDMEISENSLTDEKEEEVKRERDARDDLVKIQMLFEEAYGYIKKDDTLNLLKTNQKIISICKRMIDTDSPCKKNAMYILGTCFEQGQGVPENINTAIYWYERAAAEGDEASREKLKELKKEGD